MRASAEVRRLAPRNVAQSWIQRENWQFDTHNLISQPWPSRRIWPE